MGCCIEVCRTRGLKVNADKSKVKALDGDEGLGCKIHVGRARLDQCSEFKYLECIIYESVTDVVECGRKLASGREVLGTIRSLVNDRGLQHVCV